jgi:hypothetical protein
MLYYTSFLILCPILAITPGQSIILSRLYTILLGFSILNHAKKKDIYFGKQIVETTDRIIGHIIAIIEIYYGVIYWDRTRYRGLLVIFWTSIMYAIYNYHIRRRVIMNGITLNKEEKLMKNHIIFHIVCAIGGTSIIIAMNEPIRF